MIVAPASTDGFEQDALRRLVADFTIYSFRFCIFQYGAVRSCHAGTEALRKETLEGLGGMMKTRSYVLGAVPFVRE